jgi:site-specific recombinase XerD
MGEEQALITLDSNPVEYAVGAWLHSKINRTGSERTGKAYLDAIRRFRTALQALGLDLNSDTARVADVAQLWCATPWAGQDTLTAATHNQRMSIISSFYRFARKRGYLTIENPIDRVERSKVEAYASARPLDAADVEERMSAIDRSTNKGKRDYALLGIALYTGRRLAELVGMRWDSIPWSGERATLTFRAKGGKIMTDALPLALSHALREYVEAVLGEPDPSALVWVSLAHNCYGQPLSRRSVSDICQARLGTTKVHATRHTFALGMVKSGAPMNAIQARLGHANLSTTSRYLTVLQSAENEYGDALAALFGLDK